MQVEDQRGLTFLTIERYEIGYNFRNIYRNCIRFHQTSYIDERFAQKKKNKKKYYKEFLKILLLMRNDSFLTREGVTRGAVNSKAMTPNYQGKGPSNAHRPSKNPSAPPLLHTRPPLVSPLYYLYSINYEMHVVRISFIFVG